MYDRFIISLVLSFTFTVESAITLIGGVDQKLLEDNFTEEEKNGFYKAIYSRRDVRSHFISKPIEDNVLSRILHAAHHAPSVGFSQPWNFIVSSYNFRE